MSKPVVRIVLAVLIALAVIAAFAPGVQARLGSVFSSTGQVAEDEGLGRTNFAARNGTYYQSGSYDYSSGGCDHESSSIDD